MLCFFISYLFHLSQSSRLLEARRRLEASDNVDEKIMEFLTTKTGMDSSFDIVVQFSLENMGQNARERCAQQGLDLCMSVGAVLGEEGASIFCKSDKWSYIGPDTIDENSSYLCARYVYGLKSEDTVSVNKLMEIAEKKSTIVISAVDYEIRSYGSVMPDPSTCTRQSNAPWGLAYMDKHSANPSGGSTYVYEETDGEGTVIYIIDTGSNPNHKDFEDRLVGGYNFPNPRQAWDDTQGHGTHVMATAGGKEYGIAKKAGLYAMNVFGSRDTANTFDIINAIDMVVQRKQENDEKAVINMSLGGFISTVLDNAANNAVDNGVTVVTAAGNYGWPACWDSPGRAAKVINVASHTSSGALSGFSNTGSCVDIIAPGSDVLSAYPGDCDSRAFLSGTSMASPHVAGVVATIMSRYNTDDPNEVKEILFSETEGWSVRDKITNLGSTPNIAVQVPLVSHPDYTTCGDNWVEPRCGPQIIEPAICSNVQGWVDIDGDNCGVYSSCLSTGYESVLAGDPDYYNQWANNGVAATDACCACGGGVCNDHDEGLASIAAAEGNTQITTCAQAVNYCNLERVRDYCPVTCGISCI